MSNEEDYEENPYGEEFSEKQGVLERIWTGILYGFDAVLANVGDSSGLLFERLEGGGFRVLDSIRKVFVPRRWRSDEPDMLADMDSAAPPGFRQSESDVGSDLPTSLCNLRNA